MTEIVPHPPAAPEPGAAHVDALPAGTRLAEFEIRGLLGVGGFGLVYRAYDTSLHRTVAIKEYMPAALAGRLDGNTVSVRSSSDQATYQSGLQSFIAEARLLAQFDHPSLVKVYRFWEANNTAYMVMPLYSGMTLKQARSLMATPPPEEWLRTVLWSVLQGLHVLHRSDTLHRDVSPDNIFLQDVGPPVLLDLGAARRAIHGKSHKLTVVLKVNYAPIEQYAEAVDLKQGPWTDLYSLAAAVYSCLCNDPPLPATARAVRDSLLPVRQIVGTVKKHFGLTYSESFVRTIQHALALQPADRPQSLAAFVTEMKLKAPPRLSKFDWRAELGSALHNEDEYNSRQFWHTQPQALSEAATQGPARHRRRRVAWGAGLVVAVLAVGSLAMWMSGPAREVREPVVAGPEPAPMPAPIAPEASEPVAVAAEVPAQDRAPALPAPTPAPKRETAAAAPRPAAASARNPALEERKSAPKVAAAPAAPESGPAPSPAAPVAKAVELCASANFFSRPLCIHQECKKPEHAQLPVCVEDRQRYPEPGQTSP